MATAAGTLLVPAGQDELVRCPAGGPAMVKARTWTANGSLTCLEVTIGPGAPPPSRRRSVVHLGRSVPDPGQR
jgi:hypothetical protein